MSEAHRARLCSASIRCGWSVDGATTIWTASRNCADCCPSQLRTAAAVRPSTCPSRPWPPAGAAEAGLIQPQHRRGLRLPELVVLVGDQHPGHRRPRHPETGRDLVLVAAVLDRLGNRGAQPSRGPRPRRLRLNNTGAAPPHDRSSRRVHTHPLGESQRCPHCGHRAASGSDVSSPTTLTPSRVNATHSTASPANPNRPVAPPHRHPQPVALLSLPCDHSDDHRVTGHPHTGTPDHPARSRSKSR